MPLAAATPLRPDIGQPEQAAAGAVTLAAAYGILMGTCWRGSLPLRLQRSSVQIRSACGVVPAVPVGQQRVGLFRPPAAALVAVCGNDVVEHRVDDLPGGLHGVLAGER